MTGTSAQIESRQIEPFDSYKSPLVNTNIRGRRILIVDDFPGVAASTAQQLSQYLNEECLIQSVSDPFQAVKLAEAAINNGEPFECLILDTQMRGFNPESHQTEYKHGDSVLRDIAKICLATHAPLPAAIFYSRDQDRAVEGDIARATQRLRWEVPPQIANGLEALVPITISSKDSEFEDLVAAVGHCMKIVNAAQSEALLREIGEKLRLSPVGPDTANHFMGRIFETIHEVFNLTTVMLDTLPAERMTEELNKIKKRCTLNLYSALSRCLVYEPYQLSEESRRASFLRHELRNEFGNAMYQIEEIIEELGESTLSEKLQSMFQRFKELKLLYQTYWDVRHAEREHFNLYEELQKMAVEKQCPFNSNSNSLHVYLPRQLTLQVLAQPLSNAFKFTSSTPNAVVQITAESIAMAALPPEFAPKVRTFFMNHVSKPERLIHVTISDNGPGIPSELQDKIFETGFTTSAAQGGTGWGLGFVRESMKDLRSVCFVESAVSGSRRGTRFHFFFEQDNNT